MIKRPLIPAAVTAILFSIIAVYLFPALIFPDRKPVNGEITVITGTITKIEEKENSCYVYLVVDNRKALMAAGKDIFDPDDFMYGQGIEADCLYKEPDTARNPGNYDESSYLRSLGIGYKYKLRAIRKKDNRFSIIPELLRKLSGKLKRFIKENAPSDTAGILIAMITGSRSELDAEVSDLYRSGGVAHILAISGLHISFVGMGIFRLLRKRVSFCPAAAAAMLLVVAYAMMSGSPPSAVRAVIMLAVRLLAEGMGKTYDILSAAALSAILILCENPFYVTNTGFLLSFSAVTSIAVLAEPAEKWAVFFLLPEKRSRFTERAVRAIASSFSITLGTLPIIVNTYYEYPPMGFLLNLFVIPLTSYILGGGLFAALSGLFSPVLGKLILGASVYILEFISFVLKISGRIPFMSVSTGHRDAWQIIVFYVVLLGGVSAVNLSFRREKYSMIEKRKLNTDKKRNILITAVVIALLISVVSVKIPSGNLNVMFLDVDQGKCVLILSPAGKATLIDGGSTSVSEVYGRRIESALKYQGVSRIENVFISHPDADHISGILELLSSDDYGNAGSISIGTIYIPDFTGDEKFERLLELAEKHRIRTVKLEAGVFIEDSGMGLECIYPSGNTGRAESDTNEMSAVLELSFGTFSALFTGDIGMDEEKKIISLLGGGKEYDILDVPHHGSRNSSSDAFLSAVSPKTAIISAGVDNSYGHPHKEALKRLQKAGCKIYSTQDYGGIMIDVKRKGRAVTYSCSLKTECDKINP